MSERTNEAVAITAFIRWVEEPLAEARVALEKVPLRMDEHKVWLEVFRGLGRAQEACAELKKLAAWHAGCNGKQWRSRSSRK